MSQYANNPEPKVRPRDVRSVLYSLRSAMLGHQPRIIQGGASMPDGLTIEGCVVTDKIGFALDDHIRNGGDHLSVIFQERTAGGQAAPERFKTVAYVRADGSLDGYAVFDGVLTTTRYRLPKAQGVTSNNSPLSVIGFIEEVYKSRGMLTNSKRRTPVNQSPKAIQIE